MWPPSSQVPWCYQKSHELKSDADAMFFVPEFLMATMTLDTNLSFMLLFW